MRILLQFPEGLKKLALDEAKNLEGEGHEVFISASQCFGACDLALDEARAIGAERIIHWGHSDFGVRSRIPVEYREYRLTVDVKSVISTALPKLIGYERIGVLTTVQHLDQLDELKSLLREAGKKVFIGRGTRARYPGQVLGCDSGAAEEVEGKVDCYLYFGGGLFHPKFETRRRVLRADPFSGKAEWMDRQMGLARKRRKAGMNALVAAKSVGILVSTKPGQKSVANALRVSRELEKCGKRCPLLVSNTFDFGALRNFRGIDCYVNSACPRLSEDSEAAGKPIINLQDAISVARMLVKND
jgi:2-(3-amino-3-carboxypropyl)histidine synthase